LKILAVESTSMVAGAALMQEDKLIGEILVNHRKMHSEQLLPMIDQLLKNCECLLEEIDVFAASIGPGSFTGIRIGVATVKGLSLALGKPVIGVSSLMALASQVPHFEGWIIPMVNAQKNLVYTAAYHFEGSILTAETLPDVLHIQEWMAHLKTTKTPLLFLGDALPIHRQKIEEAFHEQARFADPVRSMPSAAAVAQCAMADALHGKLISAEELHPVYLRSSQAEKAYLQQQELKKAGASK
jgi:tRNA threonylcarbamoyladenosine biosynthesis protein TsaB